MTSRVTGATNVADSDKCGRKTRLFRPGWEQAMLTELAAKRFTGAWIRIHDSGDFFSDDYLHAWLRVCRARPDLHFYAYTKEVDRFRRLVEPDPPSNFLWVYSYGYRACFTCCSRTPTWSAVRRSGLSEQGWQPATGGSRAPAVQSGPAVATRLNGELHPGVSR